MTTAGLYSSILASVIMAVPVWNSKPEAVIRHTANLMSDESGRRCPSSVFCWLVGAVGGRVC
jgi:hypothetical protein